ncbi:CRTAC1 family protein [Flavitalea antarctica]
MASSSSISVGLVSPLIIIFSTLLTSACAQTGNNPFVFRDATTSAGILPGAVGIYGHGAAWGDADGDGWIDLYIGTFDKDGKRNMLFRNKNGRFSKDQQTSLNLSSRTTGIVFADLDNDGDLDIYIGSMPQEDKKVQGNSLFENTGQGVFRNISADNAACPKSFGGRSVTILDYNGDGLPDILAGEDPLKGYNGSPTRSSRLFKNKGKLKFEDVTASAGLPAGIPGYGVASADLNNDSWPDLFIASNDGGNLLFLNDKKGRFRESAATNKLFQWPGSGGDNMVCGVSLGDVNRDGFTDIVLGPHFEEPWASPQPLRLFINRLKDGNPSFEEVTKSAGLNPIPLKAPHVEIQDFDNDGLPDIYTSVVKFKGGRVYPLIFRQTSQVNGVPRFAEETMAVNDFPTAEDKGLKGQTGVFFAKVLKERKIIYSAAGPTGDYDNDGRLDMFLPSWWPELPSMLLHNETKGGNWLKIQVKGTRKVNRMGIGSKIRIYQAGKLGQAGALLACQDISVGYGYASGQTALAHVGLGKISSVDIEVTLPNDAGKLVQKNVKANQKIVVQESQY